MGILYTIYIWLILAGSTFFWGALYLLLIWADFHNRLYFHFSRSWARTIVFLSGVKIVGEGSENIPATPCIFMLNHQSYFDVICLAANLDRPARFVAKRVLVYLPVFGQLLWLTGHIIIKRENARQAFAALNQAADKIRRGTSITVFPEGTRSSDHRLGPFKKGGFVLALKAQVPIIPVSVMGTQSMMPKGKYSFRRPDLVRIRFGKPIEVSRFTLERKQELMDQVRQALIAGFSPETPEAKANLDDKLFLTT